MADTGSLESVKDAGTEPTVADPVYSFMPSHVTEIQMEPAPQFSCGVGQPALATIYSSHYRRMGAVIEAARTGNDILIRLALVEYDKWGSKDDDEVRWRASSRAA